MKAIVFDFDGTLTCKSENVWVAIWEQLGYPNDDNSLEMQLFRKHANKEITHEQWFDLTCEAFKAKKMSVKDFVIASKKVNLIQGIDETVNELKGKGYSLFIVSGCIEEAIRISLGKTAKYFDAIVSNNFVFDRNGKLQEIIATQYDYEGKREFIEILKRKGYKAKDITFVGNSSNDEWAYLSGCKTICINPDSSADIHNKQKWNYVKDNVKSLKEILPIIQEKNIQEMGM